MSPPLSPALQRLLAHLEMGEGINFARLQDAIYHTKFTGPVVLHCYEGVPQQVDLGSPIRLSIVEGVDTAKRSDPR